MDATVVKNLNENRIVFGKGMGNFLGNLRSKLPSFVNEFFWSTHDLEW
jgi:hypothetical protein